MQNQQAIAIYDQMVNNVSEEEIKRVNSRIGNMCKGALKKVWGSVVVLVDTMNDKKVSWGIKAIAIGALLYTVSPADAIPDIIPILGLTDDAAIIGIAITTLGKAVSKYKTSH